MVEGGSIKASTSADKEPAVKLSLSDILVTDISTNSATLTWKTNTAADSLVEYGLEKDNYFLSSSDGKFVTDHTITLENAFLTPGVTLHFRIKSKDDSGQEVTGENQLLQLRGYTVKIKVTDENNNPVSGVEVLLYSDPRKAVTNANGETVFENVSPGKHLAVVKTPDGDRSTEVQVTANQTLISEATIKISKAANQQIAGNQTVILALTIAGIIVVLIAILVVILRKRRPGGSSQGDTAPPPTTGLSQPATQEANPPYTSSSG